MKIVIVEWIDVDKELNQDTFDEKMDIDSKLVLITTLGWNFRETDTCLMVVQEFNGKIPRDYVVIPKSLIKKIMVVANVE